MKKSLTRSLSKVFTPEKALNRQLYEAASKGLTNDVPRLLKKGADPNWLKKGSGLTSLGVAIECSDGELCFDEVVEALVNAKAIPKPTDYLAAIKGGHTLIFQILFLRCN